MQREGAAMAVDVDDSDDTSSSSKDSSRNTNHLINENIQVIGMGAY